MDGEIAGYQLVTDFTTAGGGQSRWAFVTRAGKEYFLKEFLKPKYPVDGAPGSKETKKMRREACSAFEQHHRGIQKALRPLSSAGGNLVVATDFFRAGPRYYKVTERVEVTNWDVADVARLPLRSRLLLMITVAHSLNVLHRAGLVHGDIKPPNILIKRVGDDRFSTKLIDFDNAVLADRPLPPPDQLVGDMAYYSPELVRYINEPVPGTRLGCSSDVFALGLVFTEWLTGSKPKFDVEARYAGVASARGEKLSVDGIMPSALAELVASMIAENPASRPTAAEVHSAVRRVRDTEPVDSPGVDLADVLGIEGPTRTLRGSLLKKKAGVRDPEDSDASSLRGSLVKKAAHE
jgi:serine/threonine protein kinase